MRVDLGRYAGILDPSKVWHGPAETGPGGIFAMTHNPKAVSSAWTVHEIDPRTRTTRPVLPFASFEAARRAASSYAATD